MARDSRGPWAPWQSNQQGYCQPPQPYPGRESLGHNLQVVRAPCDINGPLAENSAWPYEVLVFPISARPAYSKSFNLFTQTAIAVADRFVSVLTLDPGDAREGRALEWGVNEVNAAGTLLLGGVDLQWRFVVGTGPTSGSAPEDFNTMMGQWSNIASPVIVALNLERDRFTSLQVLLPAAGGTPRSVRALSRGWMAPFHGGGTFASGAGRS